MSRITDHILDKESKGELIYDDCRGEYMTPSRYALAREIEYLQWQISSSKADLKEKVRQFNNTYGGV